VDNFEWKESYTARFGLIGLDVETGKRTLHDSGQLYGEIIRGGELTVNMLERHAPELIGKAVA
jgi:beta-glucosidase/6-phospho-beta-glucosidase/beta-galactosidase